MAGTIHVRTTAAHCKCVLQIHIRIATHQIVRLVLLEFSTRLEVLRSCRVPLITPIGLTAHPTHPDDEYIEPKNNEGPKESNRIVLNFATSSQSYSRFWIYGRRRRACQYLLVLNEIHLRNAGRPTEE